MFKKKQYKRSKWMQGLLDAEKKHQGGWTLIENSPCGVFWGYKKSRTGLTYAKYSDSLHEYGMGVYAYHMHLEDVLEKLEENQINE